MTLHAPHALLPDGWAENVRIAIDAAGAIAAVEPGAAPAPGDMVLAGRALLPAPANLHSHAFQRAMAGMTETRGREDDDFWSWRELMYRFLAELTPDDIEAIAAQVQLEMLEAGFAAIGEFHYLHHAPGGARYDRLAETSHRIAAAAATTGIGLTHLPVLYTHGGAGGAPLGQGQIRFGAGLDEFLRLHDEARAGLAGLPADCRIGIAPHSLRATTPGDLDSLLAAVPEGPVHIHAAEQVREVEDVVAWLGARPVEALVDRHGADARWCLIHATQMEPRETEALARSGAVAGLCPITEANLGDGIFDGVRFLGADGALGVGSDSNVRISLREELVALEYSQRLRDRGRNRLAAPGASTGETIYRAACRGGAQALGRGPGALVPGAPADLVALDLGHLAFEGAPPRSFIDRWLFAGGDGVVTEVWAAGRHVVTEGRHRDRERIEARFRATMRGLRARI